MLFGTSDNLDSKTLVTLFVKAGSAEPGPPLGTVLGNLGVNASKFCKDFNAFTSALPNYIYLKVKIVISISRSYEFSVDLPSTGFIISLLKFEKTFLISKRNFIKKKVFNCILLTELIKLAKFKFPNLKLEQSFKIV